MMSPASVQGYYDPPERQRALIAEARAWIGTPFAPRQRVKGAGVDCVQLCAAVYLATGFLEVFDPPAYPVSPDGLKHSLLVQWIEESSRFASIIGNLQAGDLLTFRVEHLEHHTGLYLGLSEFIHCRRHKGVTVRTLRDSTYHSRLITLYRPLASIS